MPAHNLIRLSSRKCHVRYTEHTSSKYQDFHGRGHEFHVYKSLNPALLGPTMPCQYRFSLFASFIHFPIHHNDMKSEMSYPLRRIWLCRPTMWLNTITIIKCHNIELSSLISLQFWSSTGCTSRRIEVPPRTGSEWEVYRTWRSLHPPCKAGSYSWSQKNQVFSFPKHSLVSNLTFTKSFCTSVMLRIKHVNIWCMETLATQGSPDP